MSVMRSKLSFFLFVGSVGLALLNTSVNAQKARSTAVSVPKPIIFAVLNDGQMIEPIAHVEKGKLSETVNGSDESAVVEQFTKTYFGAKASYRLIFGGANAGTVSIKPGNSKMECAPNMAQVNVAATRPNLNLRGKVMALATNVAVKKQGSGVRRLPNWPERNEIDLLVKAEFTTNSVDTKKIDYHNLTALDVNGDKKPELVGSFWAENEPKSRTLLFFIAEKGTDGKLSIVYSDLRTIKEDEVMSGEISAVDEGVYHELLLDVFDYDGDGISEIFTYVQAFEGASFYAYKRTDGKWAKIYEVSNYHCGY